MNRELWIGRVLSALAVLFLTFDATMKLLRLPMAIDGTTELGYPASVVFPLGIPAGQASGKFAERCNMTLAETLLQELEQEAQTTRRVLERVPDERLAWRPHPKARTLGELALHIAIVPGAVAELSAHTPAQAPQFTDPSPAHATELIPALDESIAKVRRVLSGVSDAAITAPWRLMLGERELINIPRIAFLRSVMLNHWYHHRGQLSVYLRELDVPIPSIYGPSADENPFG